MPSGKLDRSALASFDAGSIHQDRVPVAARDDTEARLLDIWRRVLGQDLPLGVDDDFFAMGGHSLSAVRLAGLVQQAFGQGLTIVQLIGSPTIAAQARLLARHTDQPEMTDAVIRLRPGGETNLFCIHPASGTATCYLSLSRALDSGWAPHGVQLTDTSAGLDLLGLAAAHAAAIRRVQPLGPYRLLGWSVGGIIALEVARQLRVLGEKVERVVLLDSYAPGALRMLAPSQDNPMRAFAGDLAELAGLDPAAALPSVLPPRPEALLELPMLREPLAGLSVERLRQIHTNFVTIMAAVEHYEPLPVDWPVTLFRAAAQARPHGHGWQGVIRRLGMKDVPGRHATMLLPPNVTVLAHEIDAALRPQRSYRFSHIRRWMARLAQVDRD